MAQIPTKGPTQRQLRVGEVIRQTIAEVLARGDLYHPALSVTSVTVSQVRISPDLKNATVYVAPLGGLGDGAALLEALAEQSHELRHQLVRRIRMRHAPRLTFRLDESFETASRVHRLLLSAEVQRDLRNSESSGDSDSGQDGEDWERGPQPVQGRKKHKDEEE